MITRLCIGLPLLLIVLNLGPLYGEALTGETGLHWQPLEGQMSIEVVDVSRFCRLVPPAKKVRIEETVLYGVAHYKITTPKATYFLDRLAGGFSSIIDEDGWDWVAYRPARNKTVPGSAGNAFRGLPNMVFLPGRDEGAGHPGFSATQSVKKVAKNRIRCVSNSGKFVWEFTFWDTYLRMELLKTDPKLPHWILYEGPVGGTYHPAEAYWGTADSISYQTPNLMEGGPRLLNESWCYFGDKNTPRVFFAVQQQADDHPDLLAYMGAEAAGLKSSDGMIVFGFGRDGNTRPQITAPNTYYFGFYPHNLHREPDKRKELRVFIELLRRMN
ncbi:hypothetical protein [Lewinella sp. W8]|uniref:hypothetical protein n=1 Tax=Lewinella sp. W8 TaxID=2528208 RepID=UPI0010687256|nr:hypothetical protein [Lewinella sp. W8]MTB50230.1 hypothetical protein [Lewinella sp. W8]